MVNTAERGDESAIGNDVVVMNVGPNCVFRKYVVDRQGPTKSVRSVEAVLDVSVSFAQPIGSVWAAYTEFNSWMNRFGYVWEGLPADENGFIYLGSKDPKHGSHKTKYVVRKVIPERLIYFDSLPRPLLNKDGVFTGHNVACLTEDAGRTKLSIFMEHTWCSETMKYDELRGEAKEMLEGAVAFWRDYFVPDLVSLVENGRISAA